VQVTVLCPLGRLRRYRRRTLLVASYRTRTRSRTPIGLPRPIPTEARSPPDLIPPLPHHPTIILLSRKHHSYPFHSVSIHPLIIRHSQSLRKTKPVHSDDIPFTPNITTRTLPTIPFSPSHYSHISDTHYPNNKTRATPKHSHSPLHLPTTHNLRHFHNSDTHAPCTKEQ
jgi:hypothetical protein